MGNLLHGKVRGILMQSSLCADELDLEAMRALMRANAAHVGIVDFEEHVLLPDIRKTMRIWKSRGRMLGFAYVDDFENLWFEVDQNCDSLPQLEDEIVEWGLTCVRDRGPELTLDSSCDGTDSYRIGMLERHGFGRSAVRTLRYSRRLDLPITEHQIPADFSIRPVSGTEEVPRLVALHRLAFGTENMTVERRLAMMSTPQYQCNLDLLAVAPNGELAAFCVCGWDDQAKGVAFTDPIGTHPRYRGLGLASALVSAGLCRLRNAGALTATLGTSSDNVPMQRLATALGFDCVSERVWFSKRST